MSVEDRIFQERERERERESREKFPRLRSKVSLSRFCVSDATLTFFFSSSSSK